LGIIVPVYVQCAQFLHSILFVEKFNLQGSGRGVMIL
jgi:hypothetical protein